MLENKIKNTFANNTIKIWNHLKKHGGLDEKYYDKDIISNLRAVLELPSKGNFENQLQKYKVGTEDFLEAFFSVIQPFSKMMSDLLVMFERAGAKKTSKNLLISFDFDKKKKPYKFDIEKFKETIEIMESTIRKYSRVNITNDVLWRINDVLKKPSKFYNEDPDRVISNISIKKWIDIYYQGRWPDFMPSQPLTGITLLDQKVNKIWRIWEKVVEQGKSYCKERYKLWEEIHNSAVDLKHNEDYSIEIRNLAQIDSDNWPGEFIWFLCYRIEKLNYLPLDIREDEARKLENGLDDILKDLYSDVYNDVVLEKNLKDFFNLPIWEKRYELYAAWVSSQIISALETADLRFHIDNNVLNYSFAGVHIASSNKLNPELQVWTELRTKSNKLRSTKRKDNIQPDYSLAINPAKLPESSILVVECKQYKKASNKNFSDAIQDYAEGRPNATIILVNYGEASQKILQKVNTALHDRVHLIGNMRPGLNNRIELFKKIVLESIKQYYIKNENSGSFSPWINLSVPANITLRWEKVPRDLDLYIYVYTLNNEKYKICFNDIGNIEEKPMALYKKDIQDGIGPEIIDISTWMEGKYHIFVNNFSKDSLLAGSGATVELSVTEKMIKVECPMIGDGEWWDVFKLDTTTGKIEITNRIIKENEFDEVVEGSYE